MTRDLTRIIGIAVASCLVAVVIGFGADPFGRRKAAETRATVATQQAEVATTTTQALDRVIRSEVTIRNEAQGAVEHVEQAQGADDPLSPAVGLAVRAGIERLRDPAGAGADHAPSEPASPL